jgi:hypothetical protein
LPHEVTHTILAYYFGVPIPRWADEGAAVLAEDDYERERYDKLARQILDTPDRAIPLRRLFMLRDYPGDALALWAEGYSVTRFLVEQKDHGAFLQFVKQGMREDWDKAAEFHYNYANVEELERAWLAQLGKEKPVGFINDFNPGRFIADPTPGYAKPLQQIVEPVPSHARPPLTALASASKDGPLIVRFYISTHEEVEVFGGGLQMVNRSIEERSSQSFNLKEVKAFSTDGRPIDNQKLPELLQKETPVLVSATGMQVHPFHLQLVKEGTIILIVPLKPYRKEVSGPLSAPPAPLPKGPGPNGVRYP